MASIKTLKSAIARKRKQLVRQQLKAKHSKQAKDRFDALDRIKELKLEVARLEQQIQYNQLVEPHKR